jgi:hypothetical protein
MDRLSLQKDTLLWATGPLELDLQLLWATVVSPVAQRATLWLAYVSGFVLCAPLLHARLWSANPSRMRGGEFSNRHALFSPSPVSPTSMAYTFLPLASSSKPELRRRQTRIFFLHPSVSCSPCDAQVKSFHASEHMTQEAYHTQEAAVIKTNMNFPLPYQLSTTAAISPCSWGTAVCTSSTPPNTQYGRYVCKASPYTLSSGAQCLPCHPPLPQSHSSPSE